MLSLPVGSHVAVAMHSTKRQAVFSTQSPKSTLDMAYSPGLRVYSFGFRDKGTVNKEDSLTRGPYGVALWRVQISSPFCCSDGT